jgi:hypothetical protein
VNPAKKFGAGHCKRRGPEPPEAEHWTDAWLDTLVVLRDQVVQGFDERNFVSAAS